MSQAVYIHIPFCTHKCHYCDFTAYVVDGQPVEQYLTALELEMRGWTERFLPEALISIFVGGGTPTILSPAQMERLLTMIERYFPRRAPAFEFTVEANPETTTTELLSVMKAGGINRISFGAQTFHPALLRDIGRIHGVRQIIESVEAARKAGFTNLSLDLMFGLPGQRVIDMENALKETIALQPEHLSCYSLKVEEGTRFFHLEQQGKLPLPDEEDELEMYQLTRRLLPEHGLNQYEISNFAIPGKESLHNSMYWRNQTFYGLGAGAHGYLNKQRYANVKTIRDYIAQIESGQLPIAETWPVSQAESMENFMMLGLRLLEGVSRRDFFDRYQVHLEDIYGTILEELIKKGLLLDKEGHIKLSERGILFGNEVFAAFLN